MLAYSLIYAHTLLPSCHSWPFSDTLTVPMHDFTNIRTRLGQFHTDSLVHKLVYFPYQSTPVEIHIYIRIHSNTRSLWPSIHIYIYMHTHAHILTQVCITASVVLHICVGGVCLHCFHNGLDPAFSGRPLPFRHHSLDISFIFFVKRLFPQWGCFDVFCRNKIKMSPNLKI